MTGLYKFIELKSKRPEDSPEHIGFDMCEATVLYAIHKIIDSSNHPAVSSIENPPDTFNTLFIQHSSDSRVVTANTLTEILAS